MKKKFNHEKEKDTDLQNSSIAIINLYLVFTEAYPLKKDFIERCCPCCVAIEDRKNLLKPLRTLLVDDFCHYIDNALWTWGDEEDFKYFLPRILELNVYFKHGMHYLTSQLKYSNWLQWPSIEKRTFLDFCIYNFYNLLENFKFYEAHEWGLFLIELREEFNINLDFDIIIVKNICDRFLRRNKPKKRTGIGCFFEVITKLCKHDEITEYLNIFEKKDILHLALFLDECAPYFWDHNIISKKNFAKAVEYRAALEESFFDDKNKDYLNEISYAERTLSWFIQQV